MIHPNTEYPWLIHRDEVDLLEEEIDEIYELFYEESPKVITMEQQMIQEQIDLEELAEVELTRVLNTAPFLPPFPEDEQDPQLFPGQKMESLKTLVNKSAKRHPFYNSVYVWSQSLFRFARDVYAQQNVCAQDAFRVFVNVSVIPVKLLTAMEEELKEDSLAPYIAEKEYRLACVYFDMVMSSLANMALMDHALPVDPFFLKGRALKKVMDQILAAHARKRGHGFSREEV